MFSLNNFSSESENAEYLNIFKISKKLYPKKNEKEIT